MESILASSRPSRSRTSFWKSLSVTRTTRGCLVAAWAGDFPEPSSSKSLIADNPHVAPWCNGNTLAPRIVILAQIITLGAVQPGHSETLRREASYQVAVIPRAPSGVTPADFDSSAAGRRRAGINRDRGRCHGCDLCGLQSRLELRTYFCNGYNSQVHWWRGVAVLKRECQSSGPVILKHDFVHAVIIRQILENDLHLAHNCLEWRAAGRDVHVQPISWKNVTRIARQKVAPCGVFARPEDGCRVVH